MKAEAKEFLEWLVTSDIGKNYLTKEFKFIPAFSSIQASEEELGDLATDIMKYSQENKTLSWNFNRFPEGVPQEFGSTIQAYVAGKSDKKHCLMHCSRTGIVLKISKYAHLKSVAALQLASLHYLL